MEQFFLLDLTWNERKDQEEKVGEESKVLYKRSDSLRSYIKLLST
jgi:hypothetical protein